MTERRRRASDKGIVGKLNGHGWQVAVALVAALGSLVVWVYLSDTSRISHALDVLQMSANLNYALNIATDERGKALLDRVDRIQLQVDKVERRVFGQ